LRSAASQSSLFNLMYFNCCTELALNFWNMNIASSNYSINMLLMNMQYRYVT
jgi:hypothetical protein